MLRLENRKGYGLATAILVLAIISAAVAAGFAATNAEITTNQAERGVGRSYAIAQSGLEQFLLRRADAGWCQHCTLSGASAPPNADSEWTRVTMPTGYADVYSRRVHVPVNSADGAIYMITSLGTDTTTRMSRGGQGVKAQRMVGLYASWPPALMLPAAFTALAGLKDTISAAVISGVDLCSSDTIAGVTTPDSMWINRVGVTMKPVGSPPFDTLRNSAQVDSSTHINWAAIMGNAMTPTVEIPPSTWPAAASPIFADTTNYPIIRIHTNGYTLPAVNNEFGLIICDSDCYNLTNHWKGVFLVGGKLTQDHGNTSTGGTVTGLNALTGGNPAMSVINSAGNSFLYNSCVVALALKKVQPLQTYAPMSNTWMDNLPIY